MIEIQRDFREQPQDGRRDLLLTKSKGLRLASLVILFAVFCMWSDVAYGENKITVLFRFDDVSVAGLNDRDLKILKVFQEYDIPCTLAVIPFLGVPSRDSRAEHMRQGAAPDPTKIDFLRKAIKAGLAEVALHGYDHQNVLRERPGLYSEFLGLDQERQERKISRGKSFLEQLFETTIVTFVPPWDNYDSTTIGVLETLGFEVMSAGFFAPIYDSSRLHFLPSTCSLNKLRRAIIAAAGFRDSQPIIVVEFHKYDFAEVEGVSGTLTLRDLATLLVWLKSRQDITFLTIGRATRAIEDLSASRFTRNFSYRKSFSLLPSFLWSPLRNVYLSSSAADERKVSQWIFSISFHSAFCGLVAAFLFCSFTFAPKKTRLLTSRSLYISVVLVIAISLIFYSSIFGWTIGANRAMVLDIILGGGMFHTLYVFKTRKTKDVSG